MKKYLACAAILLSLSSCDWLPSWMGGAKKEVVKLPGEREDVLLSRIDLQADPAVAQVPFKLPPSVENPAWAQPTGQFTAANANLKAGDLMVSQRTRAGNGGEFSHSLIPQPIVADGKLFAMDAQGAISAHDAADIDRKYWTSDMLVREDGEVMGGGLTYDLGKLYAASGLGRVGVLDATTGAELWHKDIGFPIRSAPRVAGDKLFVITIDSQLFALDAATGTVAWVHRGIGETAGIMNNVSPAIAADMVIVPYASGELYALRRDSGEELWRVSLAQAKRTEATSVFSGIGGDPVVDESVVFAVSSSGLFSVYNILNGQPLWERQFSSLNTPWLVGDYIYALTEENLLIALVKYDGRIRWATQLSQFGDPDRRLKPIVWRGPVMVDGRLAVVSTSGEMKLIDAGTGEVTSTIEVADGIGTSPVVAAGRLYLMDKDANLYSFQ